MILIRGLPGSGKSTLAQLLCKLGTFSWFEADHFFLNIKGDYEFKPRILKAAHEDCRMRTHYALAHNSSVIVSNTFSQKWEMKPYLTMAKAYNIEPLVVECKGQWPNIHNVPQEVIERMKQRWESYP